MPYSQAKELYDFVRLKCHLRLIKCDIRCCATSVLSNATSGAALGQVLTASLPLEIKQHLMSHGGLALLFQNYLGILKTNKST